MTFGVDSFGTDAFGAPGEGASSNVNGEAGGGEGIGIGSGSGGEATGGAATFAITLNDVAPNWVFQRIGAGRAITISGTVSGATAVEARIVQHGTSTAVVDWTMLDPAPNGGVYTGQIDVPTGGPYNVQVRCAAAPSTFANGVNPFVVGARILIIGQSNAANWYSSSNVTPSRAYRHAGSAYPSTIGSWSAMTSYGAGETAFAKLFVDTLDVPVGLLNYAIGGTGVTSWDAITDTYARDAYKAVQDVGGDLEMVIWSQGEGDALAGMSQATYQGHLQNVIAAWRAAITNRSGRPHLPWLMNTLGRGAAASLGSEPAAEGIRAAQRAVIASVADVYHAATLLDLPLSDTVHLTTAGYIVMGQRFAQTALYIAGGASYHRGPYVVGATQVDATHTDVTIAHRGGSDFTPSAGINGFELDDGGSVVAPSAADRISATVIRLTHAAVSASATVRYGYGMDGGQAHAATFTNALTDNSARALPLEQFTGLAFAVSASAPGGEGVSTGSGSGGEATGQIAGSAPGGEGVSTGSGSGGEATGGSGTDASAPGGEGTGTGSGSGGEATGQIAGSAPGGEGVSTGTGSGGEATGGSGTAASAPGGEGISAGSGSGGEATGQIAGSAPGGEGISTGRAAVAKPRAAAPMPLRQAAKGFPPAVARAVQQTLVKWLQYFVFDRALID